MAKDANQFIFREEYEKWLHNLGVKSDGAYCPQDKYTCNDGREFLFFDLIGVFAKENDRLYVNALFEEWKAFKIKTKTILRPLLTACLISRNIDSSLKLKFMVKKD